MKPPTKQVRKERKEIEGILSSWYFNSFGIWNGSEKGEKSYEKPYITQKMFDMGQEEGWKIFKKNILSKLNISLPPKHKKV